MAVALLLTVVSFSSCDNDAPNSPYKFEIYGIWKVGHGLDSQGSVCFMDDGVNGYCLLTDSETGEEVKIPFKYDARISKVQPVGTIVIKSILTAEDFPGVPADCIAFSDGEYTLSIQTTDNFAMLNLETDKIVWHLVKK